MRPVAKAVLLGIVLLFVSTGCSSPVITSSPLSAGTAKSIRVVADENYPPYVFRDSNGNLQGIVVDQWNLWEKKTGVQVFLTGLSWDNALEAMKNGEYDVIDTIFLNEDRSRVFDFTGSYTKVDVSIFFSSTLSGINGLDSLHGFSVAVKKGDFSAGFLRERGISYLSEYVDFESIIKAAEGKKELVFVMEKPAGLYLLYKSGIQDNFNYATTPLYTGELRRAVKKGNAPMLQLVEGGFASISDGELEKIDTKWRGTEIARLKFLPYFGYASAAILLIAMLLILWNMSLKRMVGRRTGELEEALELLKMKESENAAIIKAIPQLILLLDNKGRLSSYLSTNQNDALFTKHSQFVGRELSDVLPVDLSYRMKNAFDTLMKTGITQRFEYALKNNQTTEYYESSFAICDNSRVLAFVSNITERKKAELKLYELSIYDSLTHFYNRNYFEQKVDEFQKAGTANIGYVTCDLDGLKLINDTMGHVEGDSHVRLAADIIRRAFGEQDIVARIGGDEFGILIQNADETLLEQRKEKLISLISQANQADRPMPISMSLGYAIWTDVNVPLTDILKDADDSMYRDKLNHMQSIKSKNIEILTEMLQARDFSTEEHGGRLQDLAGQLAQTIGLSTSDVRDIMLLAKFHDIGKIGISDAILFKPGRLTDEEMQQMRRHTEIGYRIASSSPDLIHIADWILKHHEKYDGTGYPLGLKGNEIPIQCRIVAIMDAYDAMTNDRPYRNALTIPEALKELRSCAWTQFDPVLIEKFCNIVDAYNPVIDNESNGVI